MLDWFKRGSSDKCKTWVQMEYASSPLNLASILCAPSAPPLRQFCSNPVVYHSIRIWSQFRRHFKLQTTSVHFPISNNYNFPPSLSDSAFEVWSSKGIKSIFNLYSMSMASLDHVLNSHNYLICRSQVFFFF